jgi:DNA polymerase
MTEDTTVSVAENATRFELDDRQRAMLAEMGVRVWMPQAERAAPASVAAQTAAPPTSQQGAASTSVHPVSNVPQMVSVPIVVI